MFPPIEGETPIDDVSGLRVKLQRFERSELDPLEADNISRAFAKYLSGSIPSTEEAPFDLTWMLHVHREMFDQVWDWAGKLRTANLNIGVPFGQVETRLYDLTKSLEYWPLTLRSVADLHHRLVSIHPFKNGNGRWSRLVANIRQVMTTETITIWPDEMAQETSPVRQEYLAALKSADKGDLLPLETMHGRYSTPYATI